MRTRTLRTLVGLALGLLLPALAKADIFVMKDGRRIEGTLVKEEQGVVTVKLATGELKLARSDIAQVVPGKTPTQQFDERMQNAKTAEDFFQAGEFALSKRLKREAQQAWQKAVEIDPDHAEARLALGFVLYKGSWLTPAEREARIQSDEIAEMSARGLVRYKDQWVSPADKEKLEQGLVLIDGQWISFADSQRKQGLEEFEGAWFTRPVTLARRDLAAVQPLAGVNLEFALSQDALVAGSIPKASLESIAQKMTVSRGWFDTAWNSPGGLALFGGRLAEIYAFGRDSLPYTNTVAHFASLTRTVPPGWAESVAKSHGFFWVDPYPLSSARQWNRGEADLVGHCLHHWGHLLVDRLGYDGRLLPAWYEEAVACHSELRGNARIAVFCRGSLSMAQGTSAGAVQVSFSPQAFREGNWREYLKAAFEQKAVPSFDKLSKMEFANLEMVDIATGMAVVEWLQTQKDGQGLRAFHDAVRKGAPRPPERVILDDQARQAVYEGAFRAAAGMGLREADQAWRKWFLAGG
ncbi:MAG: hypothetical protein ABI054_08345 [Planctomycetota bacterium]